MTPEAKVKKAIRAILDEAGVYYAMPIGTGYGNSGVPDFLCCVDGTFVGLEAKAGKGRATALQEKNLRQIRAACGVACVVHEDNLHKLPRMLGILHEKRSVFAHVPNA